MNPFQGFFQNAGNFVQQGVQQGEQDLGGILQKAKSTIMQIGDKAAQHASLTQDPAEKAKLHAVAADAYSTASGQNGNIPAGQPDLGGPQISGQSAQQTPQSAIPQEQAAVTANNNFDKSAPGQFIAGAGGQADPAAGIDNANPMNLTNDQAYSPYGAGVATSLGLGFLGGGGAKIAEDIPEMAGAGKQAVQAALEEGKAQPGGLQAGFVKPSEFTGKPGTILDAHGNPVSSTPPNTQSVKEPLPQEPAGTSVQFNKDGTETIVPQGERTNAAQYAQEAPPEQPPGAKFTPATPAQPVQNVPIQPPPRPATDKMPVNNESALPGGDPKQAPQAAVNMLDDAFTVPAKKAMNGIYKMDTYKGMVAHMQSGMDPAMIEQMPALVSDSETGIVPKMIREVVGNVKGEIPLKDPGHAAESIIDNNRIFIDDKAKEAVLNDITRALPKSTNGTTVPAEDVLQYARALESKAAEIKQGDTYLTNRGDKRYLAQALNSAADDVMDQLGQHVTPQDLAAVKTPERMSYLNSLSPRLAAQVQGAQDVPKLRSSIRDFVRMGQIIEHTDASSGSVFGKVGRAMLAKTKSEQAADNAANIAHGLFHPRDAFTGITRGIVKGVASPFDETPRGRMLQALKQPVTDMPPSRFAGKTGPNMGKGMKIALGTVGGGAAVAGATHMADQAGDSANNPYTNIQGKADYEQNNTNNKVQGADVQSQGNHVDSIGQNGSNVNSLPGTIDQMPADGSGLRTFNAPWQMTGSDGKSLSMTPEQYKTQRNSLQQQYASLVVNDPNGAALVKGQMDQLDTAYNTGTSIANAWTKASQVDAKIRDAMTLSQTVSPQAIQSLPYIGGMAENIRASFDPKYHQLLQDLQYIQQNSPYGQGLTSIGDKATLTNTLQTVNKNMWGDYLIGVQHYAGVAPAGGGTVAPVSTQQEAPAATTTNQAPTPGGNFNISGGSPQMAPSFKFQSGQPAFTQ